MLTYLKSIWSTLRNPQQHARDIKRAIDGCIGDDDE